MKAIAVIVAALLCAAMAVIVVAGLTKTEDQSPPRDDFMGQKRLYSQKVLEGLMKEQYDAIVIAGEDMRKMKADKRWQRFLTEDYKRYSEQFQIHAQALVDAAREKKLDAAMDAYMECLQTCYNCHKYVRAQQRAKPSVE